MRIRRTTMLLAYLSAIVLGGVLGALQTAGL